MDPQLSLPPQPNEPKDRETLKSYFRRGSVPSEQHYADLIDSTVNRHDDQPAGRPVLPAGWQLGSNPDGSGVGLWEAPADEAGSEPTARLHVQAGGKVGIGTATPASALDVRGFVASQGRMGTYCDARQPGIEVPADGQWHSILTGLDGLQAFELVAAAYGPQGQGRYAIAHAIALSAYGKSRSVIRQDSAWFWGFFQKIQFRWTGTLHDYGLQVRTASSFGPGGRLVYHITRLFDDCPPPSAHPGS